MSVPIVSGELRVLKETCRALLRVRGEASSTSLAHQVVRRYTALSHDDRTSFFGFLLDEFSPDPALIEMAIDAYRGQPGPATAQELQFAAEAPRRPLLGSVNTARGGIQCLLTMRSDCLEAVRTDPTLSPVEQDLEHLLRAWFNRGLLTLERIDWQTPAAILEKLIEYEAVHEIQGWDDLRRRLEHDRRCFGFFHPSLPDEPLIFVEVALTAGLQASIHGVLDAPVPHADAEAGWDTAIFYSITNCQPGLRGIPLGSFLLKRVTSELQGDVESLTTFSTLSPVPGLVAWVADTGGGLDHQLREQILGKAGPIDSGAQDAIERCVARYLVHAKRGVNPRDTVARFHLRNGARLERINWAGDTSPKGLAESFGVLVNYVYDPAELSENHEAYMNDGEVRRSTAVDSLAAP